MTAVLPDLVADIEQGELRQVRAWLRRTLVEDTGRLAAADFDDLARLAQWNAEEHEQDQLTPGPSIVDREAKAASTVGRVLVAAADVPMAAPLLAAYLRFECELAWEVSWHHEPIQLVIDSAIEGWERIVAAPETVADPVLTSVALAHLRILAHELVVETAAACASLTVLADKATATAEYARWVRGTAVEVRASYAEGDPRHALADQLASTAGREARYYTAVAHAATAVHTHFSGGTARVSEAIDGLAMVEARDDVDDLDRSELRAHRHNLEALRAEASRPWATVEYGRIVYLYPFGLRGATPAEAVEGLRATGERWTLAGMPVTQVLQDLLLNDIWKGNDPLQRQYRGAAVRLPDIEVPDPDREEPHVLELELRLSALGNHYLRMSGELADAAPHEVYAAMLRAAPEFGDLSELELAIHPVEPEADEPDVPDQRTPPDEPDDGPQWTQLAELSAEIVADVAVRLREYLGRPVQVSGRPGLYHVMLTVERASATRGEGVPEPIRTARELTATFGAQPLCHPVRHGVSSVGEWLRYPVDDLSFVDAPGFSGDAVLRTGNTTLLVIPGSPNYMINAVEEAAEFVATLDGLFATWQDELAQYYRRVRRALAYMIKRLEGSGTPVLAGAAREPLPDADTTAEGLMHTQAQLEQEQLRLHEFVMSSRLTLMFVTSPALVTSPVMRLTIDRLLDAAGFARQREQFVGIVDEVLGDRFGTLIDASVRRHQERVEAAMRAERERAEAAARLAAEEAERVAKAQQARMNTLAAVIAAVGISGLAQILQAGYDIQRLNAFALALAVFLVAVLTGVVVHRSSRSRGTRAEPPTS